MNRHKCKQKPCRGIVIPCKNKVIAACLLSALIANVGCSHSSSSSPTPDTIALSASSYSVAENGTSVAITVSRSGSGSGAVSVDYATADNTATASSDYTAASGTLNWADGDTASKTITVNITDDHQYEGDETVDLALSNVSGGTLGTSSATLTIIENDVPGTLAFSSTAVGVTETDTSGTQATLTVSRTGGSDGNVTVDYTTADGSANSSDYTTARGTLTWTDGDSTDKTITVDITGDTTTELSETFTVSLSNPQFVNLDSSNNNATVTIADNDSVSISGTVSAPGATVAFNGPSFADRMLAFLFGNSVQAAISDYVSPVAGVTVNVYEVDATGALVSGTPITTATTDSSGAYVLAAPLDAPASKYIVRAEGSTGNLDSRISATSVDVDPVTNATSVLVAAVATDLTTISNDEVLQIEDEVGGLVENVDAATLTTATAFSDSLKTEAQTDEDVNNVVTSTAAGGSICGNVKDTNGTALANIRIVVRDFGNWVTRAKTKTDASGNYCLNVPISGTADPYISGNTLSGEYIIGALNYTNTSMAASQWWTSTSTAVNGSGGSNNQYGADKITVANSTTVTKDFVLDDVNGARIEGTVTNSVDNTAVQGMKVIIRNYDTFKPLSGVRVKADGSYRINVKAGDYMLSFRNKTKHPYASEVYRSGTSGVNNRNMASRETMVAGQTYIYDATLDPGVPITGIITDELGIAIPGQVVSINNTDGGRIEKLRTNKEGKFRIMVNPRLGYTGIPYVVTARGQIQATDTNGADDMTKTGFKLSTGTGLTFNAAVTKITGTLVSAADGTTPVSQAVMFLRGASTSATVGSYSNKSLEVSAADGTFTLYTDTADDYVVQARMDSDNNYGSGIYVSGTPNTISATQFSSGTTVTVPTFTSTNTVSLGTIEVPTLGVGSGVGYLVGQAGDGGAGVNICINGTSACGKNGRLVSTTARGDGTFKITLPLATYPVSSSGSKNYATYTCTTNVSFSGDGATTNLDFTLTAPQSCTVTVN